MNALEAAIDVAATYRLTQLVVEDEIARPVREWVESATGSQSALTYLVNCPACTSVWAAAVVLALPTPLRLVLALSAGALLIEENV